MYEGSIPIPQQLCISMLGKSHLAKEARVEIYTKDLFCETAMSLIQVPVT